MSRLTFGYDCRRGRSWLLRYIKGFDQADADINAQAALGGFPLVRRHGTHEVIWRRPSKRRLATEPQEDTSMPRSTAVKAAPAEVPASRFTRLGERGQVLPDTATDHVAVRDSVTGLVWQAGDSEKRLTHKQAEAYAKKLRLLGAKDWRLPTVEELFLLADRSKVDPAIDKQFFPTCKPSWYWTGTAYAASPAVCAWFVAFDGGFSGWYGRGSDRFVRAVRPGQ